MRHVFLAAILIPAAFAMAISNDDVSAAQARAYAAQAARDAAEQHLTLVIQQITESFHNAADYIKATADADDAQTALEDARAAALVAVHASAEYRDALAAAIKAQDAVKQARDQGLPVADLAQAALDARSAVSRMETAALSSDPVFIAAKQAMAAAHAALVVQDAKLRLAELTNHDYQQARLDLDRANAEARAAEGANSAAIAAKNEQDTEFNNQNAINNNYRQAVVTHIP